MTDKFLLEYFIKSQGYTNKDIADYLLISLSSLSLKLNNKSKFNQLEIAQLTDLLHLTGEDVKKCFANLPKEED